MLTSELSRIPFIDDALEKDKGNVFFGVYNEWCYGWLKRASSDFIA